MSQKHERNKPFEKSEKVRIKEPSINNPESAKFVNFVAFTSSEALQCHLEFDYGSNMPTEATCHLRLPSDPTSVEVYDLFNRLFKASGRQTQALHQNRRGDLEAWWTVNKQSFKKLTQDVKEELGEEWSRVFLTVSNHIGKDFARTPARTNQT